MTNYSINYEELHRFTYPYKSPSKLQPTNHLRSEIVLTNNVIILTSTQPIKLSMRR